MADNVKIGVALEFTGFDSDELTEGIKEIEDAMKAVQGAVPGGEITIDDAALQKLEQFAISLRDMINVLNAGILELESNVKAANAIEIFGDADVQKLKTAVEEAFNEALAKMYNAGSGQSSGTAAPSGGQPAAQGGAVSTATISQASLKSLSDSISNAEFEIADSSIKSLKDALSQGFKDGAKAIEQSIKTGASSITVTATGGGGSGGTGGAGGSGGGASGSAGGTGDGGSSQDTPSQDTINFWDQYREALDKVNDAHDNATTHVADFMEAIKSFYKGDAEEVKRLAEEFQKFFTFGFDQAQAEGAKDPIKDMKNVIAQYGEILKVIARERDELQQEASKPGGPDRSTEIKALTDELERVVEMSREAQRELRRVQEFRERGVQAAKVNEGIRSGKAQKDALQKSTHREGIEALESGDVAKIQGFLRPFENLNLAISKSAQKIQVEVQALAAETRNLGNEAAEAEKRLEKALQDGADPDVKTTAADVEAAAENERLVKSLKAEKSALDARKKSLSEQYDQMVNWQIGIRETVQEYRSLERVLGQQDKIAEQAQKKTQTLDNAYKAVKNTVRELTEQTDGQFFLDESQAQIAKKSISEMESQVKDFTRSIKDLELAEEHMVSKIEEDFDKAKGAFDKGLFKSVEGGEAEQEAARQEAKERKIAATRKRFIEDRIKMEENLIDVQKRLSSEETERMREQVRQSKVFQKATVDVKKAGDGLEQLGNRYERINKFSKTTTSALKSQAKEIDSASSEWNTLQAELSRVGAELQRLEGKGGSEVRSLQKEFKALSDMSSEMLKEMTQSGNLIENAQISADAKSLDKAEKGIIELTQSYEDLIMEMNRAQGVLDASGGKSREGAKDMLKVGSNADKSRQKLNEYVNTLKRLEAEGYELSDSQRRLMNTAKQVGTAYEGVSNSVAKNEKELQRVEKAAKRAGKGFLDYSSDLGDSIIKNFQFINAIGIVTSALAGARRAITELIQESKSFAQTMTVMRSDSMNFAQTLEQLQTLTRSTAIQFGKSIEDVSSIVYELGSAGLDAETSFRGLNDIMKIVVSTGVEATEVSRSVAGVYNVFGDQMDRTYGKMQTFGVIADAMTSIYRDHQIEISELTQGLGFVSAAARDSGFTFLESANYLGVLNDNMMKSGRAGRGLQRVFAQFAAKSDTFADAFNVELDPDSPLSEQFVGVLEEVNSQIGQGAINLKELNNLFKTFGLRGAPTFSILARNVENAKEGLEELKEDNKGTADEMSDITQDSLAQSFERAKQALLEFARDGLEPLNKVLKLVTGYIEQFREGMSLLGDIGPAVMSFTAFAAVVLLVSQSFMALNNVLGGVATRTVEMVEGTLTSIGVLNAETVAVEQNTNAKNKNAAATGKMAKGGSNAAKVVSTAFSTMNIGIMAISFALMAVIPFIGKLNTSMEELNREGEKLTRELREIARTEKDIRVLRKTMSKIQDDMENTAISSEKAGERIRKAFEAAGSDIVGQADIRVKTNEEIADSAAGIAREMERQLKIKEKIVELERAEKEREAVENFRNKVLKQAGEENFLGVMDGESLRGYFDSAQDLQRQLDRGEKVLDRGVVVELSDPQMEQIEKEARSFRKKVDAEIGGILEKFTELEKELGKNKAQEEIAKIKEELEGILPPELMARINRFDKEFAPSIIAPIVDLRDEVEETGGTLNEMLGILDVPFDSNIFEEVFRDLDALQKRFDRELPELDAFGLSVEFNELEMGVGIDQQLDELSDEYSEKLKGISSEIAKAVLSGQDELADSYRLQFESMEKAYQTAKAGLEQAKAEAEEIDHYELRIDAGVEDLEFTEAEIKRALQDRLAGFNQDELKVYMDAFRRTVEGFDPVEFRAALNDDDLEDGAKEYVNALAADISSALKTGEVDDLGEEIFSFDVDQLRAMSKVLAETFRDGKTNAEDMLRREKAHLRNQDRNNKLLEERANIFARLVTEGYEQGLKNEYEMNDVAKARFELMKQSQEIGSMNLMGNTAEAAREGMLEAAKQIQPLSEKIKNDSEDATDAEKENLKTLKAQFKQHEERLRIEEDFLANQTRFRLEAEKREDANQSALTSLRMSRLERVSALAQSNQQIVKDRENLSLTIKRMNAEERLNGYRQDSLEAINELVEKQQELVEMRREYTKTFEEESIERLELIGKAEEMLDVHNKYANLQQRVQIGARRYGDIMSEIADREEQVRNGELTQLGLQSEKIELYGEYLNMAEEFIKLQEELEELEEKKNDLADKRLQLLAEMADSYDPDIEYFEEKMADITSRHIEITGVDGIAEVARQLEGYSFQDVLMNQDKAVRALIEGIREGYISADILGGKLEAAAEPLRRMSEEQKELNKEVDKLSKIKMDSYLKDFNEAMSEGDAKKAKKALEQYESAVKTATQDSPAQFRQGISEVIALYEKLQGLTQDQSEEIKVELDLLAEGDLDLFFETIRDTVKFVKAELQSMGEGVDIRSQFRKGLEGEKISFRSPEIVEAFEEQRGIYTQQIETAQEQIDANQGVKSSVEILTQSQDTQTIATDENTEAIKGLSGSMEQMSESLEQAFDTRLGGLLGSLPNLLGLGGQASDTLDKSDVEDMIDELGFVMGDLDILIEDEQLRKIMKAIYKVESYGGNFATINTDTAPGGEDSHIGMAFGASQFTFGSGSLGKLLQKSFERHPVKFEDIFGPDFKELLDLTSPDNIRGRSDAKIEEMARPLWTEEFIKKLYKFAEDTDFQKIQTEVGMSEYMQMGIERVMEQVGFEMSERVSALAATFETLLGGGGFQRDLIDEVLKVGGAKEDEEIFYAEMVRLIKELGYSKRVEAIEKQGLSSAQLGGSVEELDDTVKEAKKSLDEVNRNMTLQGADGKVDRSDYKKYQSGGRIPGYGGGDRVPAMLEQGEYVIPKHRVGQFGQGFFDAIKDGKLKTTDIKRFQSGGQVGGGSAKFPSMARMPIQADIRNDLIDSARKFEGGVDKVGVFLMEAADRVTSGVDKLARTLGRQEAIREDRAIGDAKREVEGVEQANYSDLEAYEALIGKVNEKIEKTPLAEVFKDGVTEFINNFGDQWTGFVHGFFVPEFAEANAQAFADLQDRLKDITKQFREQFREIETGLKRNETSYYDYLNAIEDAERSRLQARRDAQKEYQDRLIEAQDVLRDAISNQFGNTFEQAGDMAVAIFDNAAEQLFGKVEDRISLMTANVFGFDLGDVFGGGASDDPVVEAIENGTRDIVDSIKYVFGEEEGDVSNELVEKLDSGVFQLGTEVLGDVVSGIGSIGDITGEDVDQAGVDIANYFKEDFLTDLGDGFTSIFEGLDNLVTTMVMGGTQLFIDGILTGIGSLVEMSLDMEEADYMITAMENFIDDLPEAAPEFIKGFLDNIDRIFEALLEGLPIVLELLIEEIPELILNIAERLGEFLPQFIGQLSDALPQIIEQLVPALIQMVRVLIQNIPKIIGAIARSIPMLIKVLLQELPFLVYDIVVSLFKGIGELIKGLFTGFLGIFHDGGVIGGSGMNSQGEVPIIAQTGEGVLSREGMKALGGAQVLNQINSGNNPFEAARKISRYHDGGVVRPPRQIRSGHSVVNSAYSPPSRGGDTVDNRSVQMNVSVNGKMTDKEVDNMIDRATSRIDSNLSKSAKDRSSKFAKTVG